MTILGHRCSLALMSPAMDSRAASMQTHTQTFLHRHLHKKATLEILSKATICCRRAQHMHTQVEHSELLHLAHVLLRQALL